MCKLEEKGNGNWDVGMSFLDEEKVHNNKFFRPSRAGMRLWIFRAMTTLLVWTCIFQLSGIGQVKGPRLLKGWPACSTFRDMDSVANATLTQQSNMDSVVNVTLAQTKEHFPPKRVYKNNGYLVVSCNGGLNQMRAAILPLLKKHKVVHLNKTDARLANNGLPVEIQRLRCRVNYSSLRFTAQIEELGRKVVSMLKRKGPFLVLHLRYEMDMLAFSGCTKGCHFKEVNKLTEMRYGNPLWKEKDIDSGLKRKEGLCPLTPEETALVLSALGIDRNIQIYIAAGEIYGGKRRLRSLREAFPNLVKKETLLEPSDLLFIRNHSSQMAALDYLVSLESEVFIPTYDGNMAKVVEGHRRHLGFKKTILLDRKVLIHLIDQYNRGSLSWDEFSSFVKKAHENRIGSPKDRLMISDKPKEEDYFYANPQECLAISDHNI